MDVRFLFTSSAVATLAALVGCESGGPPPRYARRDPGCEVKVFPETPSYPTENIGPVNASCDEGVSDGDCLRTLKDQACKLGADTVWGVNDQATLQGGKKHFSGRAAHQK